MRKRGLFHYLAVIATVSGPASLVFGAPPPRAPKFVGATSCKTCHKSKKKGNQWAQWAQTKHAQAYQTLATPAARKAAAARGVEGDPQQAPECLRCHVTGYDAPADRRGRKYSVEDGVGCESCHGAGGNYKKKEIMKDKAAAIAAGLVVPDEKLCRGCHNQDSPTFQPFDYDKKVKEVLHPLIRDKKPDGAGG